MSYCVDPNHSNYSWKKFKSVREYADKYALHYCDSELPSHGRGSCVDECSEDEEGRLFVGNGEYGSQINFCPYCGYEAKIKVSDELPS